MTPADELTAAADKLRGLLADLGDCRGPWYVVNREQRPYPQRIDNIGVPYVVASTITGSSHPPTMANYIATMHPVVGNALADLLVAVANDPDDPSLNEPGSARHGGCDRTTCPAAAALAAARAIHAIHNRRNR